MWNSITDLIGAELVYSYPFIQLRNLHCCVVSVDYTFNSNRTVGPASPSHTFSEAVGLIGSCLDCLLLGAASFRMDDSLDTILSNHLHKAMLASLDIAGILDQ